MCKEKISQQTADSIKRIVDDGLRQVRVEALLEAMGMREGKPLPEISDRVTMRLYMLLEESNA